MEPVEKVNEDFNKKSKKKGIIIGVSIGVALLVIAAVILIVLLMPQKPQKIFGKAIDNMFTMQSQEYDSVKSNVKMKASIEANDSSMQKQLSEIEKFALIFGTQVDIKSKEEIIDLGFEYDGDSVIDAKVYYNDSEIYTYLKGIYDNYIKLDIDEEQKEQLNEIFDTASSKENMKNSQKAMEIFKDELKNQLEEEGEFEQEKATIEIKEKEKQVTKSTVTITEKNLYKIMANMSSNLANNDKFLDCFETSMKSQLKEASDAFKEMDGNSNNKIKISIYTDGLFNDIIGVNIEVYVAQEDSTISITALKEDKDLYTFTASMKQTGIKIDVLKGKLEIEKDKDSKKEQSGKATFTVQITGVGKAKLVVDYSVEYNNGIDKVNTSNSVDATKLTEKDLNGMLEKLQKRPLIGDLIKTYLNSAKTTTITPAITSTPTITTPNTTITPSTSNTNNSTTAQNEVKYDYAGYSVKYSIPSDFEYESNYSYDYNKSYRSKSGKDIDAKVSIKWDSEKEYMDDIEWDRNYYAESTYYKNVNLSDIKTIKVGDNEFKYKTLSYESNSDYYDEKYQKTYVWYNLDEKSVFVVAFETTDAEVTEDIIRGFLNINVTKL